MSHCLMGKNDAAVCFISEQQWFPLKCYFGNWGCWFADELFLSLWSMHMCMTTLCGGPPLRIPPHGFYPHDEECSTLLPTVFLFLLRTFKTSFVCFRCHWRALMCTHQHWELCPRAKLSTLSSKSLGHDSVNIYFTFPAKLEYWNLKLLSHLAGLSFWGTPQRAGSWSKKVSTVIICNVMHGSLSNFFHSHTTTATSRTGLWVNQISLDV